MSHASIPSKFWDEIFSSTLYLINRLPSNNKIPYTTLFNKTPNYSVLKILGCLCFPYTRDYNQHKLQLRALPCIFLGYAIAQKGYRCLHLPTNKIYISRNVQFDEQNFPFAKPSLEHTSLSTDNTLAQFIYSQPYHPQLHLPPQPTLISPTRPNNSTQPTSSIFPTGPNSTTQPNSSTLHTSRPTPQPTSMPTASTPKGLSSTRRSRLP
jgi:hypothetical protein